MKAPAIGRTAPWMILALLFAGIGIWLAGRVAVSAPAGKTEPGPPTKPTKVADRPAWPPQPFLEEAEKGMTIQQIREILEDYDKFQLAPEDAALLSPAILEGRQKQWYLETIGSGLRLSSEARENARRLLAALPADGEEWGPLDPPLSPQAPAWLRKKAAAPAQLLKGMPVALAMGFLQPVFRSAGEQKEIFDLRRMNHTGTLCGPYKPAFIPEVLLHAAYLFPFWERQKFPPDEEGIERQIMVLHPAQFQTLLLLDGIPPGLVQRLDRDR